MTSLILLGGLTGLVALDLLAIRFGFDSRWTRTDGLRADWRSSRR